MGKTCSFWVEKGSLRHNKNTFPSPIDGGPKRNELTPEQKRIDKMVREVISYDLDHSREAIVKTLYEGIFLVIFICNTAASV